MTVLTGEQIGIKFGQRWLYQDVNFTLQEQHVLAVICDNGVGKTTLIRSILGQQTLTTGHFTWTTPKPVVRYVPQERPDAQDFPLRIEEFVGLSFDRGLKPWRTKLEQAQLANVLVETHLSDLAKRRIDQASGGERQRAYLAQALLIDPGMLILDEATANLDNVAKYELMDVVRHYQNEHQLSIIMISHDLEIIKQYADDYLLLKPEGSEFGAVKDLDITELEVGNQDHA